MKPKSVQIDTDLLRALRRERQAKQLSQFELGKLLGITQANISLLERGRVDPQLSTLQNVAGALDLQLVLTPRALWPAVQALVEDYHAAAQPDRPPTSTERPLYRLANDEDVLDLNESPEDPHWVTE